MKVILVDIDKTLCEEECWTSEECLNATPRKDVIDFVNKISLQNIVILYTARMDELMTATFKWVKRNDIRNRGISNTKIGCDILIDDKGFRPEELLRGGVDLGEEASSRQERR